MSDQTNLALILKAAAFAADKHRTQRRKDAEASPYINHPLALAHILCSEGDETDPVVIAAALLHDTVEDTETTPEQSGDSVSRLLFVMVALWALRERMELPVRAERVDRLCHRTLGGHGFFHPHDARRTICSARLMMTWAWGIR